MEMMKETYQEEMGQLREKIRLIRTVQREERRKFSQSRAQQAGVVHMNRQICCEYAIQNA